jgi:hypothetical protein
MFFMLASGWKKQSDRQDGKAQSLLQNELVIPRAVSKPELTAAR